ncbi:hypothetical protein [Schlesneria sp.]
MTTSKACTVDVLQLYLTRQMAQMTIVRQNRPFLSDQGTAETDETTR